MGFACPICSMSAVGHHAVWPDASGVRWTSQPREGLAGLADGDECARSIRPRRSRPSSSGAQTATTARLSWRNLRVSRASRSWVSTTRNGRSPRFSSRSAGSSSRRAYQKRAAQSGRTLEMWSPKHSPMACRFSSVGVSRWDWIDDEGCGIVFNPTFEGLTNGLARALSTSSTAWEEMSNGRRQCRGGAILGRGASQQAASADLGCRLDMSRDLPSAIPLVICTPRAPEQMTEPGRRP